MDIKIAKISALLLVISLITILPNSISITANNYKTSSPLDRLILSPRIVEVFPDDMWDYWEYADLKGLDPWGDSESKAMDIVAIYEKEEPDSIQFRLDFLDLPTEVITPTLFAVDFMSGGTSLIDPGIITPTFDIEWDLMVTISGTTFTLYDASFTEHPDLLVDTMLDRQLDFVVFAISRNAFIGWDGSAFSMQAMATDQSHALLDKLDTVSTVITTGRAKLVLPFGNFGNYLSPADVSGYDGFGLSPDKRSGLRYLLDAVEKYKTPLTVDEYRLEILPGLDYLRISDRIRSLTNSGLLDPLFGLGYGHFMCWQPDDVDAKAIELATEIREDLDLPSSTIFSPYENMITPGDIQVIKDAGFEAINGGNQYRYWLGFIEDWSDPEVIKADIESLRKVHLINGIPFVFHTSIGNYALGAYPDERWEEINWDEYDTYEQYAGTDQGLHLWWRRILQDMAIDSDQEQFFTIGTDIQLTPWLFPDEVDWNFRWLASHPWIEVTTFSSILDRNWAVIDHGYLNLAPDELLIQHQLDGDLHYNAYFPLFYYGGISDGHSPLIPAGVEIEAYYDYIPYLREGALIQPARIMGDDQTPGSVIYETLQNLRAAPDNSLTKLAWLSYLMHIGEQTFHNGPLLSDGAKLKANFLLQVNKIAYAANWADQAANGALSGQTQVMEQDLDLDGENEYVMRNDQVLAIFENDGGRLEYAFAYDAQYGPVQLVSPNHQYFFKPESEYGFDNTNGEAAILLGWPHRLDGSFSDIKVGNDFFEYGLYAASYTSSSLSFELDSYQLTKTFILDGDTIHVQYEIGSGEDFYHCFSLAVNRLGVFTRDWPDTYEEIILPGSQGWQMTTGGLALINYEGLHYRIDTYAFSDSPARDEMQEREDPSTYPWGHYFNFPFSELDYRGIGDWTLSLTLRANPIRIIYLPVIAR